MPNQYEERVMWFNGIDPASVSAVEGVDPEGYLRVVSNGNLLRLMRPEIQYHPRLPLHVSQHENVEKNIPLDIKLLQEKINYAGVKNLKISCIISYRESDNYRKRNIDSVIKHISTFGLNNLEIIIVEQDTHEKFDISQYKNTKKVFIYNDGSFNKGWGYNVGVNSSTGDYLFFCDCDVVIPEVFFANSLRQVKTFSVVDLHEIIVSYDEKNTVDLIKSNYSAFDNLQKTTTETNLTSGGAFIISRQQYSEIGGFDENFFGWGYEDTAFDLKLKTFNVEVYKPASQFCFHLYHPECNTKSKSSINLNTLKDIEQLPMDERKAYMLQNKNIGDKNKIKNRMVSPDKNAFDFFDEIYCINLDKRTDRWRDIQAEFKKCSIEKRVKRFSAIEHIDGRIGCIKSHLEIIKQAKKKKLDNVLIFEDDAIIVNDNINSVLFQATSQLPSDWDLFYLGANLHTQLIRYSNSLATLKHAYATHAIAYSKNVYDMFIEKFEKLLSIAAQDDILDVWLANNIQPMNKSFTVKPILATQKNDYSDINKSEVNYNFILERYNKFIS